MNYQQLTTLERVRGRQKEKTKREGKIVLYYCYSNTLSESKEEKRWGGCYESGEYRGKEINRHYKSEEKIAIGTNRV